MLGWKKIHKTQTRILGEPAKKELFLADISGEANTKINDNEVIKVLLFVTSIHIIQLPSASRKGYGSADFVQRDK